MLRAVFTFLLQHTIRFALKHACMQDVGYDSALSLIIDVRTVIPGSGTTAPVGWTALPLFQKGPGRYVASGHYQLPLFKVCHPALLATFVLAAVHSKAAQPLHDVVSSASEAAWHQGLHLIIADVALPS